MGHDRLQDVGLGVGHPLLELGTRGSSSQVGAELLRDVVDGIVEGSMGGSLFSYGLTLARLQIIEHSKFGHDDCSSRSLVSTVRWWVELTHSDTQSHQ